MSPECGLDTDSQSRLQGGADSQSAVSQLVGTHSTDASGEKCGLASAVTRRIFSFPVMLCGMLAVLAVLTVRGRFNDPDMWWHLKTGEIIWNTHAIPRVDLFSYTTNHHAWTAHEWLSQLTIYGAYHFGGYTGLMVWLCVFASAFL